MPTAVAGERFASDLDAFGGELELAHENAGHIAAGAREIGHISLRQRVKIDGEKGDRPSLRGRKRRAQRGLVADGEEQVDLARRELAIAFLIALDICRLDVFEREVAAFLIAQLSHPLDEVGIKRGLSRLHTDKADAQRLGLLLRVSRERPDQRRRGGRAG
jgi:hypothetical protein